LNLPQHRRLIFAKCEQWNERAKILFCEQVLLKPPNPFLQKNVFAEYLSRSARKNGLATSDFLSEKVEHCDQRFPNRQITCLASKRRHPQTLPEKWVSGTLAFRVTR
jgi:hypothetical protein